MVLENNVKMDFSDVLIKPKRSSLFSRSDVNLIRKFNPKYAEKCFYGIPIIVANMATGTFEMLRTVSKYKCFVAIAKYKNWIDEIENMLKNSITVSEIREMLDYSFYTIGINSEKELENLKKTTECFENDLGYDNKIKICVDVANGYSQKFSHFISTIRNEYPDNVIVAGNVCTPEMVQELILAGADYVKIGIGPGSACLTRMKTGVGYPQISASIECADAAHGLDAGIILDGGMRCPGDIAKALVANSDMVMIGGMLSGTNEQDGEIITKYFYSDELKWENGEYKKQIIEKKYKKWYGMSSNFAQETHFDGAKYYRTSEGVEEEYVDYKGNASNIIEDILGGLRSTATYIGAVNIKDFGKCGTLIRVNRQHDKF